MPAAPVKVTVLTTLYNKGAYVEEAVCSVLANTFTDFEMLVVDDASTDGGLHTVKAIADPRIRILESAVNTGRASAANRGFDAARGEYVAVLDADDLAHPERLSKQVAFLDAHPEVVACGSAYTVVGELDRVARWPTTDRECRAMLLFGDPLIYGTAMFRRAVLEAEQLRCDPEWQLPGMDYLFTLKLAPHGAYANLPEPLISYRMGANNMRHGRDPEQDRKALVRAVFGTLGLPITETELGLQMAFHGFLPLPITQHTVKRIHAWKEHLKELNRQRCLFPADLFEAELDRRWSRLLYPIADQHAWSALVHLRLSGKWSADRMSYLAKTALNRLIGRNP